MNRIQLQGAAPAAQVATRVRRSLELGEGLSEAARARSLVPARGFVGLSLLCVSAMVAAGALSARDCRVKPIPLAPGAAADISIAIPAGAPCTILVQAGDAHIDDLAIDTPPAHGTATPRGRTGVVYRSKPRFKGDDAFAFSLRGRSDAAGATSIVRVRAKIG